MKITDIITAKTPITKDKEIRQEKNIEAKGVFEEKGQIDQDQVKLSLSITIERAKEETKKLPELREERIRELQEKIKSGTYQVSNRDLARAMISSLISEIS